MEGCVHKGSTSKKVGQSSQSNDIKKGVKGVDGTEKLELLSEALRDANNGFGALPGF
jgi:hypothetical protein